MKILVTGGAGFIGSNLVKALTLDKTIHVRVLDDLSNGSLDNLAEVQKRIEFIQGSVTNLVTTKKACSNIDVVFHLAAKISVDDSIKNPISTNSVNIEGTLNVLSSAQDNNVKKVIFSSSAAVYGSTDQVPINETTTPSPESPYALQKYVGEKYCSYFSTYKELCTVCLRYFNVYGPHQQESGGYAGVIYKFIHNALNGQTITIEGDGEQTRDFIFVEDVVNANIAALRSSIKFKGNVYNIGTQKETPIKKLAETVIALSGNDITIAHSQQRPGDIRRSCSNTSLAKNDFGYTSNIPLQVGLDKTIAWVKATKL